MIIYKLWSIRQRSAEVFIASMGNGHGGGALMRAMRIMIESGAMYTISVIVFFVVYLASNNAQYGVSDCVRDCFLILRRYRRSLPQVIQIIVRTRPTACASMRISDLALSDRALLSIWLLSESSKAAP